MAITVDLGKLVYTWQGTYSDTKQYEIRDTVAYGGVSYICKATPASVGVLPTNSANWDILAAGFKYRSTYDASIAYKLNDIVQYGGNVYITKGATVAGTVPTVATSWEILTTGFNLINCLNLC